MALITVTQYAKKTGKDVGNIRRMLASGRLSGTKIGNQWVIEESTPYPKDNRYRNGNYRNWRKRSNFTSHKELSKHIRSMVEELRNIYGDYLIEVILYGSYARGEQTAESDVDIALILKSGYSKKMNDLMIKCVAKYELECDKVLSVLDIDQKKFNEWVGIMPFYTNILREGIILWSKKKE